MMYVSCWVSYLQLVGRQKEEGRYDKSDKKPVIIFCFLKCLNQQKQLYIHFYYSFIVIIKQYDNNYYYTILLLLLYNSLTAKLVTACHGCSPLSGHPGHSSTYFQTTKLKN